MSFSFRRKDDSYINIIYMPLSNRPLFRQHKDTFSFHSIHSDPQEVGSVLPEEPVHVAEISSKQIWYPVREIILPAVYPPQLNNFTQILTTVLSLEYLLHILVLLSVQVILSRARWQACNKPLISQVSYYSYGILHGKV